MTEIDRQIALCDLLHYRESGDFAALERVVELAGYSVELTDRFFVHNLILAISFAGLIDIRSSGDSITWWSRIHLSSKILGAFSKSVPRSLTEAAALDRKVVPLITDASGNTLLLGTCIRNDIELSNSETFVERLPTFRDIESTICELTPWPIELNEEVEPYDFASLRWMRAQTLKSPAMVRVARRFGGYRYFVGFPELRLCFRLTIPEWSSFAAVHLLGSLVRTQISTSGNGCLVNRTLRIPTPMGRLLFSSCEQLVVGSQLKFFAIDRKALNALQTFFAPGHNYAAA